MKQKTEFFTPRRSFAPWIINYGTVYFRIIRTSYCFKHHTPRVSLLPNRGPEFLLRVSCTTRGTLSPLFPRARTGRKMPVVRRSGWEKGRIVPSIALEKREAKSRGVLDPMIPCVQCTYFFSATSCSLTVCRFPPPWKLVSSRCILSRCNGPCKQIFLWFSGASRS